MSNKDESTWMWVLGGAAAVLGLWWLFKKKEVAPGITTTMPVPSSIPPQNFQTLGAVRTRFDDLRDIYHMGHVTPEEALLQVDGLRAAVIDLRQRLIGDPEGAQALMDDLDDFQAKIYDFIDFRDSGAADPNLENN